MSKSKREKKKQAKKNVFSNITEFNEKLTELNVRSEMQEEILKLFFDEFKKLKTRNEKLYIRPYIRLRESIKNDINKEIHCNDFERDDAFHRHLTDLKCTLLEIEQSLEDMGVEIMHVKTGDTFDPKIHKARKCPVSDSDMHEKVVEVCSDAYIWEGQTLVPAEVKIGVLRVS